MVAKCYLEFDGFDSFLTKALKKIFEANAFPDVTLVGDDNLPIEAHRIILSAHSSVLENAIIECKSAKPTLHCKGFTYPDLHSLLSYLYLGKVSVPFAQASELLKIAKYLKISQLGQECNVTDIELNKMFSVITCAEDGNIVEKTTDEQDVDRYVTSLQSAEVLCFNEEDDIHNESTTFPDEDLKTCQSVYESFEGPVDLESINVDNSRKENEKTLLKRVKQKRRGWLKKQREKLELMPILDKQKFDDEELTNYGAEMVGKPLPNYSALRSVTYSHYYFVKLKPVDDITWARCNLCWYKIDQSILPNGKSMYVKVSDQVNKGSTANLLSHIINRHPDIVEKFLEQHAQANKARQMMRGMEEKREIKKNKKIDKDKNSELKQKQKRIERIKKYVKKSPEYDFEHMDEDILTTAVGEPKDNYNPREAIVFSHNYFRRLYPIEARRDCWRVNISSLYAECITCAQRNDRVIISTPGASTTPLNHHIIRCHPDLVLQFLNQQEAKKEDNLKAKESCKPDKLNNPIQNVLILKNLDLMKQIINPTP